MRWVSESSLVGEPGLPGRKKGLANITYSVWNNCSAIYVLIG